LRRNTRRQPRNIAAHYDLGNDFFRLFLDDNLMYSSAITRTRTSRWKRHRRQARSHRRKLALGANDRVIESAVAGRVRDSRGKHFGCHVTTTTISRANTNCPRAVAEAGLGDRHGAARGLPRSGWPYDKLVSIEMVEAIGHQYLDTYFTRSTPAGARTAWR
jgi:cyclopropane-fatty-acyl-phospholipid synthase